MKVIMLWLLASIWNNHFWRIILLIGQSKLMTTTTTSIPGMILYVVTSIGIWYIPHFANLQKRRPKHGCVFVTGCDSGMGQATVIGFVQNQSNDNKYEQIFAGCYNKQLALQHFDKVLTKEQRQYVTVVPLDVTSDDSVMEAVKTIQTWIDSNQQSVGLSGLIQYHGVAYNGPASYMPMSMYQRQLEVNFVGSIRVVQAMLPLLKQYAKSSSNNNRSRIVLTGTGGGPCSPCPPLLTAYMSSKFALEAYSQSLRQEMYMTNSKIDICVINPGFVKPTLLMSEGLKLTDAMWKSCETNLGSTIAKDEYGTMMDHFLNYSSLQPGTHVSKVVEAAEAALTSPIPQTSYKVGIDSKLAPIVGMMPTGMREWIARHGIYGILSPAGTIKGYQM